MKLLLYSFLAPLLALAAASGCATSAGAIDDHWNARSTAPRVGRFFLGYDPERDGTSYRDFAWERKQAINMTVRRHFFNHDPDNPHHPPVPSRFEPRPLNSLLPNPVPYIHWEGLILGAATLVGGGSFIPLPIDSIIGTFEPGDEGEMSGKEEFMLGVNRTFAETFGVVTTTFVHKWIQPPVGGTVTRVDRVLR